MCQYGAKNMGERGFRTAGILKHYYPGAVLRKLW
jgi:peptidoglycan hydrolase-like amidase